jgi:hypothetical protein
MEYCTVHNSTDDATFAAQKKSRDFAFYLSLFYLWGIFKNRHLSNATGRIRDESLMNLGGRDLQTIEIHRMLLNVATFSVTNRSISSTKEKIDFFKHFYLIF